MAQLRIDERRVQPRLLGVLATLTALLALSGWILLAGPARSNSGGRAAATAFPQSTAPTGSSSSTTLSVAPPASASAAPTSPSAAGLAAQASTQTDLQQLVAAAPAGSVSVAAVNTATGASVTAGATSGMWTASVYKLLVLETLLWQHEQSGTTLSATEDAEATTMIENSDNEAGYDLFLDIGGNTGEAAALTAFGMTHSAPGISDPAFTTTSASDALALLQNLVSASSPLDANSRAYALGLMQSVEADQRWGVGVVADPATTFANKNGWLSVDNENVPSEDDNGLWITTSVGVVTVHGQQVLMAVFTQHQASMDSGVALVQQLATAATAAVMS